MDSSDPAVAAGRRYAASLHSSDISSVGAWRWMGLAALRARIPRQWYVCAAACFLIFTAHLVYGANSNVSALTFATIWLAFGGLALMIVRLDEAPPTRLLIAAGACFAGVVATVASQLLPAGEGGASGLWNAVEGASAGTIDRDATLRELIKLVSLAAAFIVGYVVGASDRRARLLVFLVVIASGVYAAWAFVQHFMGMGTLFGLEKPYHVNRLTASFLSANTAATALGMLAVIAAARIARAVKESSSPEAVAQSWVEQLARKAGVASIVLLLLVICIMETQSRFGIAASGAALLALGAWEVRVATQRRTRARGATTVAFALAAILAIISVTAAGGALERIDSAADDAGSRMAAYEAHWAAFLISPLRGYGLGSFPALNDIVQTAENHRALEQLNAVHNVYLQWLEETGIVGAGLMFATIALLLLHIWRGLTVRASMLTWLRAVLLASMLVLVHGLVDYGLQVPSIAWQWALWLGVGCGIAARPPRKERSREDDAEARYGAAAAQRLRANTGWAR